MTDAELQGEQLVVLPQRMETMRCFGCDGGFFFRGGNVSQFSNIHQSNFNNQIGGDCLRSNCDQFNFQSNSAFVDQDVDQFFRFR